MQPPSSSYNPNATQDKQRKLIRLIIILGTITVVVLILSALLMNNDGSNSKLSSALARHQEINRVIEQFADNARSQSAKQLLANTELVILSGAQALTEAGVSVSTTQAESVKIQDIDDQLSLASQNNQFDEAITQFISTNLQANQADLQSVLDQLNDQQKSVAERLLADYDSLL